MVSFTEIQKAWSEKSVLEKSLIITVAILTVLAICLIIAVAVVSRNSKRDDYSNICRTSSCEELGSYLKQSMDLRKDPCEDFYAYACDGRLKNTEIPPGYRQYGITEKITQDVLHKLNKLLSEEETYINSSAVQNARMYYSSCMNIRAIESHGASPMHTFLSEIGGWPVVNDKWSDNAFDWVSAMAKIQLRTSFGLILLLTVGPDAKNTTSNILQLDSPTISLSKDTLLNRETNISKRELDGYRTFFKSVACLLGAKEEKLDEDFKGIIDFETELVKMMRSDAEKRNSSVWYNKMSIADLSRKIPEISWLRYLQMVTNSTLRKFGEEAIIKNTDLIIVRDVEYVQKVAKYMVQLKTKRHVANYLGWRTIMTRMRYLPSKFNEALQNYSKDTGLASTTPERWTVCTNLVKSSFPHVASFLFINKYFRRAGKHQVEVLAMEIKNVFGDMFDDCPWMDHTTKAAAKNKLEAMKRNMGYPEWVKDVEEIDKYYSDTPEMRGNLFEDELALIQHSTMQAIASLRKRSQRQEWSISPVTVNAAYNLNRNEITVPAAFLQFPMYSYDLSLPRYYNYATIGAVIAHEMTHGFDNEGRLRNATGDLNKWWSPEVEERFNERAQCFVDQYEEYKVNGKFTLAENIADNVGLRQAYKVFRGWHNATKTSMLHLPGISQFSPEQLFFISYASIWCTKYESEYFKSFLRYDNHSPVQFRVQGTVSNMEEFATAFNCEPRSSHNRQHRCIIWR